MTTFNREQYLGEIAELLARAKANLKDQAPEAIIYTLNVWTDPDAAASAVSFDTKLSSDHMIAFQNRRFGEQNSLRGRIQNPADFAYSGIAECVHSSIPQSWGEESKGGCWDILEPVLLEVRDMARREFSGLPLDEAAELSVNSRRDWYDHSCCIGSDL